MPYPVLSFIKKNAPDVNRIYYLSPLYYYYLLCRLLTALPLYTVPALTTKPLLVVLEP